MNRLDAVSCSGCRGVERPGRVLIVRTPWDLVRLNGLWNLYEDIVVALPSYGEAERTILRQTLLALHHECGCDAGQVAMTLGLALLAVGSAVRLALGQPVTLKMLAVGVVMILGATMLAKMLAVLAARVRLSRLVASLRD